MGCRDTFSIQACVSVVGAFVFGLKSSCEQNALLEPMQEAADDINRDAAEAALALLRAVASRGRNAARMKRKTT